MYNILITLLANLLRLFIIRRFMKIFFDHTNIKRSLALCVYLLFYAATSLCSICFHLPALTMVVNLLTIFIITLIFEGTFQKKAFVTFLVYSIHMVCDIISVFILTSFGKNHETFAFLDIFTTLFILICELAVEKIVTAKNDARLTAPYLHVLLLVPLCSISLLYAVTTFSGNAMILFTGCGILIINITVFYLYNAIADAYAQKYESELLKQQLAVYQNQLGVIMQSQEKIRSLRHDMKHHIKELMFLAKEDNADDIRAYLKRMETFMDNPGEYVYSGNMDTDGIINYMLQRANEELKDVKVKIRIPEQFSPHSFDLNIILGNLLENAIEAASGTEEKKLYFDMELEKGIIFIRISNSYHGELKVHRHNLITTKGDASDHGIGLRNVRKMVELHDGSFELSFGDGMFHTDVMLYVKKLR